jgi:hypothetical protein
MLSDDGLQHDACISPQPDLACACPPGQVYVGNLVAGLVTEDALRQLFNSTMAAAFPGSMMPGLDAVVSVSLHSEGRYAFVELRTPEMATAALQLSNQVLHAPWRHFLSPLSAPVRMQGSLGLCRAAAQHPGAVHWHPFSSRSDCAHARVACALPSKYVSRLGRARCELTKQKH